MTKKKILMLCTIFLFFLGIGAWLMLKNSDEFKFDDAAMDGNLKGMSSEEIASLMNDKVEESMLSISINTTIEFANSKSEGDVRIENAIENRYLIKVNIITEDGIVIYETDAIKPGQMIEKDHLDRELPAGSYACTATFTAFDIESHEEVGKAAAQINVLIGS